MSIEKIFNHVTILKHLSIKIDDVEINPTEIVTAEIKTSFFDFGVRGSIKIKDSFDLNNNKDQPFNNDNTISISARDFLKNQFYRTFKITKITSGLFGERMKIFDVEFIDEITYKLMNTYISRSFTDTPVNAFKEYLTHIGIDDLIASNRMEYDIVDSSTSHSFVVPQDISALEFFTKFLKQENIRFWQDRNKFYIKEIDISSVPPLLKPDGTDLHYSNDVLNNEYVFKIHDFNMHNNSSLEINLLKPIEKTFRYDGNKEIIDITNNLTEVTPTLALNNIDTTNYQETSGEKYKTQGHFTQGNQDYDVFDILIHNNNLDIVVPGTFLYSNVGTIVNISLKGNHLYSSSQLQGDSLVNGKYFVAEVSDRIVGDKIINKLELCRLDSQNPRG